MGHNYSLKVKIALWAIVVFSVIGIIVNTAMICHVGIWPFMKAFAYVMSTVLHISLILFVYKHFYKDSQKRELSGLLIRFAASMVASLMAARYGSNVVFIMLAVILLIVPYMAGDITQTKRGTVIVLLVLVLITIISIIRMTVLHDLNTRESNTFFMTACLYLNECNQLIEWASITILYFLMMKKVNDPSKLEK